MSVRRLIATVLARLVPCDPRDVRAAAENEEKQ